MHSIFEFYKNKKVFITGHTGFKGSWMCKILDLLGSQVMGYALEAPTNPNLFELTCLCNLTSVLGDIRNYDNLNKHISQFQPEVIIHMAAQPLVREAYQNPIDTYEINVMGTVNILEAARNCNSVKSVINVTTDKVYFNHEWDWGYRENDHLDGYDPYSNSKSCSELVTASYVRSFFKDRIPLSTCRAGNVIGGGDFAPDRIIPDCIRAIELDQDIIVRNPYSVRPYQHVIEPVMAYLLLAAKQYDNHSITGSYNIGPDECGCVNTGTLVSMLCKQFDNFKWINKSDESAPHEATLLMLDCSKIKKRLAWKPKWNIEKAVQLTADWYKEYLKNGDVNQVMETQIRDYLNIEL